jgi:hypothetical protein
MMKKCKTSDKEFYDELDFENKKLKTELGVACQIIEQQNRQLGFLNGHFSLFYTVTAVIIGVIALFSYFQFVKPINDEKDEIYKLKVEFQDIIKEQKAEAKNVNEESLKILKDIQSTIVSIVVKERFNVAMKSLIMPDLYNQVGVPIIQEYSAKGLTEIQLKQIDEFIRKEIKFINNQSQRNTVSNTLFYMLSIQDKNDIIDKLFHDWKEKRITLNLTRNYIDSYVKRYYDN